MDEYAALPDEPQGWRELHAKAQQERDPQRLEAIIQQMNRFLDRHQKEMTAPAARPRIAIESAASCD